METEAAPPKVNVSQKMKKSADPAQEEVITLEQNKRKYPQLLALASIFDSLEELGLPSDKEYPLPNKQFYQDSDHPLMQSSCEIHSLSIRLQKIVGWIEKLKNTLENFDKNQIIINEEYLTKFKKIFTYIRSDINPTKDLQLSGEKNSWDNLNNPGSETNAYSGSQVDILACKNNGIIVKRFEDFKKGLQELIYSLIALSINPSPHQLKMVKIYDVELCPNNSLSIIMEKANKNDIEYYLSTNLAADAIKACAKYFALFHVNHSKRLGNIKNREKYLMYASRFFNTLSYDPLKKKDGNGSEIDLFLLKTKSLETNLEYFKSNNIIQLLSESEEKNFVYLAKKICTKFEENVSEIFRSLLSNASIEDNAFYFLSTTYGDAHGNNLFFYDGEDLRHQGVIVKKDSPLRITMIDYQSIMATWDGGGDPAEDIGRMSVWFFLWASQQNISEPESYEKGCSLQKEFIKSYLKKIKKMRSLTKESHERFEKLFRENCDFYKLRFLRVVCNATKDKDPEKDKAIKLNLLRLWLKENVNLVPTPADSLQDNSPPKKLGERSGGPVEGGITHWLPDRLVGFIESSPEGSAKSYLSLLQDQLYYAKKLKNFSMTPIVGMGGSGKTSLALECAHLAVEEEAYKLVWWFPSETKFSLLKAYRNMLLTLGISTKYEDDNQVIQLVKLHLARIGRCFLVYDNVPNPPFLNNMTPTGNAHIVITSKYCHKWKPPLLELNGFRARDSIRYLLHVTALEETEANENTAYELAAELAHLPLALAHAAHRIRLEAGKNISADHFKRYLTALKSKPLLHFDGHQNPFKRESFELNYENLVHRTFSISKEYISNEAIQLMKWCAYLNPDSIAEDIFRECFANKIILEEALETLSCLSLIKRAEKEPLFSIHRLLQMVIRNEEELVDTDYTTFFSTLKIVNRLFISIIEKGIFTQKMNAHTFNYFSHSMKLIQYSKYLRIFPQEIDQLKWWGRILYTFLTYSSNKGACRDDISDEISRKLKDMLKNEILDCSFQAYPNCVPNWLMEVARNGHPELQYAIGYLFLNDEMERDFHNAYFWLSMASNQQHMQAYFLLGEMYNNIEIRPRRNKFALFSSYIKTLKNYGKAAMQGHAIAPFKLSQMGPHKEELDYHQIAEEQGDSHAQFTLGERYEYGYGVEQSHALAAKWYEKAGMQKHEDALFCLGDLYEYGHGVLQDYPRAIKLYEEAAESQQEDAQIRLGEIYEYGLAGVKQNLTTASQWYYKAAKQGNENAQFTLLKMYAGGLPIPRKHIGPIERYTLQLQEKDCYQLFFGNLDF
ncbi:MAG: sel1 repeat family protein [Alphaproteobacteria bacterium]|nr:sel1 repeat family protein [Alphaproteobacteria bacterium]